MKKKLGKGQNQTKVGECQYKLSDFGIQRNEMIEKLKSI